MINTPEDLKKWRKKIRADLLGRRSAVSRERYQEWNEAITAYLVAGFPMLQHMTVSLYWPFQGEFDPRYAIRHFRDGGAVAALPVVIEKCKPLQFREWWPGVSTSKGVFDLPVPEGTCIVVPQALLIPPVGFDARGYRLGYGGGYFDRTLSKITPQPLKIGVAFEILRVDTIRPQPHDIPMDFIVTERCIYWNSSAGLEPLADPADASILASKLLASRYSG